MEMRGNVDKSLNNFKARSPQAMERAKEIQANLSAEYPSFIKVMQRSHVTHTFYMCLPSEFCKKHIPKTDESVVLEVESGKSYNVKLLGKHRAFSGGWRGLSIAEKLLENDILVFQLVRHYKFKVINVRASGFGPVKKAHKVVKIDDCATTKGVGKKRTCESDNKCPRFVPVEILRENIKASNLLMKRSIHSNNSNSPNMAGCNPKKSSEKMRGSLDKSSNHFKASSSEFMEKAKEIQVNLCPEYPSFIKLLLRSYLLQPFCLKLPSQFCQKHLPRSNEIVVLEVESGRSYDIKLLGMKQQFSGGWKGFLRAENLLENDILVFHLVEPCKFKVYIVRANRLAPVDKDPTNTKIDVYAREETVVKNRISEREKKRLKFVPVEIIRDNVYLNNNYSSNVEGILPSETISEFKDFKVVVDGITIEFPEQVMVDYFKLCCSRKSLLHCQLIKGIDRELATSVISKTVSISNAIRDSKLSTPQEDISSWGKMLDGFEVFGMDLGFLKARLNRLSGLMMNSKRYKEAEIERGRVEKKIIELEKEKRRLGDEIEGAKKVAAKFEVMYEEEASVPW